MKTSRRRHLLPSIALAVCMALVTGVAFAYEISIDVSPNVINIQSNSTVVTVHTDIAYGAVVGSTVFLNGVAIDHWKADNRGNFVAKFLSDEIKQLDGLRIDAENEMVLTGFDATGEAFIGTQDILVIELVPAGRK
jgi:hypothetical protein